MDKKQGIKAQCIRKRKAPNGALEILFLNVHTSVDAQTLPRLQLDKGNDKGIDFSPSIGAELKAPGLSDLNILSLGGRGN